MMMLLVVIAHTLISTLAGLTVLVALRRDRAPLELEWWLPLAIGLGWVARTLVLLTSLVATGAWVPWLFPAMTMVAVVATLIVHGPANIVAMLGGSRLLGDLARIDRWAGLRWLIATMILVRLLLLVENSVMLPMFAWDGRFIWELKARLLIDEGTVFSPSLTDPDRVHFHRDYPLMLPAAMAELYWWAGERAPRATRLMLSALALPWLLWLYGFMRRRGDSLTALLFTALAAGMPFRRDYGDEDGPSIATGVADFPLCLLITLTFVLAAEGVRRARRDWLIVAGVLAGGCAILKEEGVFAVLLLPVFLLLATRFDGRRMLGSVIAPTLVAGLVMVPWRLVKAQLPNFYDEKFTEALHPELIPLLLERLPRLPPLLLAEVTNVERWGVVWPLWLALALVGWMARGRTRVAALEAVAALWLLGYVAAFVVTPLHIVYHVETASGRLLSHVQGLVIIAIALRARALMGPRQLPEGAASGSNR